MLLGGTFLLFVSLGFLNIWIRNPEPRQSATGVGGSFTLIDQNARKVTNVDLLGAPHLVVFGFTHCPDICPTKLFEISEVLSATGERGRPLRALFITVDPERDTPDILKTYLSSFDERILGLTGDPAAIQSAVRSFRGFARKVPLKNGSYTMEHTALVYLMDKDGRFVGSFDLTRAPREAAKDLLNLM